LFTRPDSFGTVFPIIRCSRCNLKNTILGIEELKLMHNTFATGNKEGEVLLRLQHLI
jgi:hypothetical protein